MEQPTYKNNTSICAQVLSKVNVAWYIRATPDDVRRSSAQSGCGVDVHAPLAFHAWLNSGRQSIILTRETMDQLAEVEIPAHDEYPLVEGQAYEFLFSKPVEDPWVEPEWGWGGIMYCTDEDGWIWVGALIKPDGGDFHTGHGQPVLGALKALQAERTMGSKYGISMRIACAALRAVLHPETCTVKPVRLASPTRRRQARNAGQRLMTLTLIDQAKRTLRIVQPTEREEPTTPNPTPYVKAHPVKAHGALCWVRAPRPGEVVEGKRISRTAVVDGKEYHTWLYGVRRTRRAHIRGQGAVSVEPRLTILQGGE